MNGYNTPVRDGWEIYISLLFFFFLYRPKFIYLFTRFYFFETEGFLSIFISVQCVIELLQASQNGYFILFFLIEWRNNNVPKEGRNLLYQSGTRFIDQIASKFLFSLLYVKSLKEEKKKNFASAGC
jgi:hypothetical protein